MQELLGLISSIYVQAPAATRWVARLSLLLGLTGIGIAFVRGLYLCHVTKKLREILSSTNLRAIGQAPGREEKDLDDLWGELLGMRVPRTFRDALSRMDRARSRPVGLPEEAWRGAYEHILGGESRWETLVRGIASAAVLVGLLGTIVGFADISGNLVILSEGALVQSAAAEKTTLGASTLLRSKLGGVFISTISGISASLLILLVGAPILRSAADQWLGVVEDAGRLIIVPALPRPPTRIQDALVEELQRRISTVAAAWESSLRGPAASLAEVAENSRRSVETAVQAFNGLRVSVEDLKELGKSAKRIREAAQSIEDTAKAYVTASDRLGLAVGKLEETFPALSTGLKAVGEKLGGLEIAVTSGTGSVTKSGDALQKAVTQMSGDFQRLQKAVTSRHERESVFLEHTQRTVELIQERLKGLEIVEQEIKGEAERMKLAVSSVALAIERNLDPLRDTIAGAISKTFGELLIRHENILVEAIHQIQQEAAETASLLNKVQSAKEGLLGAQEAVAASAKMLTERAEGLGRIGEGASSLLSSVLSRVSDAADQLARSVAFAAPRPERSPVGRQSDGETGATPPPAVGTEDRIGVPIHGVPIPLGSPPQLADFPTKGLSAVSSEQKESRPSTMVRPPWLPPREPTERVSKVVPEVKRIWARFKKAVGLRH